MKTLVQAFLTLIMGLNVGSRRPKEIHLCDGFQPVQFPLRVKTPS
jgi:hypothetical protein